MDSKSHSTDDILVALVPDHKIIFHTVPKVASTSIKRALEQVFPNMIPIDPQKYPEKHFHIGFIRHPFERIASCYANKVRGTSDIRPRLKAMGCHYGMAWEYFVQKVCETPDYELDKHLMPQHYYLCDAQGLIIPQMLVLYDNLEQEWRDIRDIIRHVTGKKLPLLQHLNQSTAKPMKFSDELKRRYLADWLIYQRVANQKR